MTEGQKMTRSKKREFDSIDLRKTFRDMGFVALAAALAALAQYLTEDLIPQIQDMDAPWAVFIVIGLQGLIAAYHRWQKDNLEDSEYGSGP